jgi:hypothetical protein
VSVWRITEKKKKRKQKMREASKRTDLVHGVAHLLPCRRLVAELALVQVFADLNAAWMWELNGA